MLPSTTCKPVLIATDPSLAQNKYEIDQETVQIGRDRQSCDIVITSPSVSRIHAHIHRTGQVPYSYILSDANSTNGLFINGQKVINCVELKHNDFIGLGSQTLHHLIFKKEILEEIHCSDILSAKKYWIIGRDKACDVSMPTENIVSKKHAIIENKNDVLFIKDLGSLNGTWVNNEKVGKKRITAHDTVTIGAKRFQFTLRQNGTIKVHRQDEGNSTHIESVGLSYAIKDKTLLTNITLTICPGEFIGILGPSGCGKTTLLKLLSGYHVPNTGTIFYNEASLGESKEMFTGTIGYVPQDDILHKELTVFSSLLFSAKLRLPPDLRGSNLSSIVDDVIEAVDLSSEKKQKIERLSGGQRKRVSIAAEIITRPNIIFLDEPTAGLDPGTEKMLMEYLKQSSQRGTTVVLSTHVLNNINLFDKIAILAEGQLVYYGPPEEALPYFNNANNKMADFSEIYNYLKHKGKLGANNHAEVYTRSHHYKKYILDNQTITASRQNESTPQHRTKDWSPKNIQKKLDTFLKTFFTVTPTECCLLIKRQLMIRLNSPRKMLTYLLAPIVLAAVTITQTAPGIMDDNSYREKVRLYQTAFGDGQIAAPEVAQNIMGQKTDSLPNNIATLIFTLMYNNVYSLPVPLSAMVMFIMTGIFLGTTGTCLEVSSEKPIIRREMATGLRITNYIIAKIASYAIILSLQCATYFAILSTNKEYHLLLTDTTFCIFFAVALSSASLGMFISAIDPTRGHLSIILAVATVLPQFILSGAMGPDYFKGLSWPVQTLAQFMPSRWGMEMLFSALYTHSETLSCQWVPHFIINKIGYKFGENSIQSGYIMLLIISLTSIMATETILWKKNIK